MKIELPEQLPEKISNYELQKLFKEYSKNNIDRDELVKQNIRLVINAIQKYYNIEIEADDLFQIGCIGLIKSIDTYDLSKGIAFSTYANTCIRNEINMVLRKRKQKKRCSMTLSINAKNPIDIEFEEIIKPNTMSIEENYELKESYFEVRELVKRLQKRDKAVITLYFGFNCEPHSQMKIADILNISQSLVSKIIKSSLNKIKYQLNSSIINEIHVNKTQKRKSLKC